MRSYWLKKYKFLADGGWWVGGVHPLTDERSDYGNLKPNNPRLDEDSKGFEPSEKKYRKYESPPKMPTEPIFLAVSVAIWQKTADRAGVPMPENIVIAEDGRALGFWGWVLENEISIIITEGAKKAACLLSHGYVAISLPGIYGGYRQPKDERGKKNGAPYLHPMLELFATPGREITFCFDNDKKAKTIANVNNAIAKTGKLLSIKGSLVTVTEWYFAEKGVDDLIVALGIEVFENVYQTRFSLSKLNHRRLLNLLEYNPLEINVPFLSHENLLAPEDAQIIALKSGKGTNKTGWIAEDIEEAIKRGIPILVLTHRIQLAKELCDRFGINHIEEVYHSETAALLGYGLCVDSLHEKSQAHFRAPDWENAIVIIDEVEQVLWHTLNSNTCAGNRVKILKTLKELLRKVISTGGKIYLADADLSKISLDYIHQLIDMPIKTWVAVNKYKSSQKRKLIGYMGKDPSELIAKAKQAIVRGEKIMIQLSAQKVQSKWGTTNLEKILQKLGKNLKILRIDGESVADPEHPAYGCINHLNEIIGKYDIVLASPVIETGISINIKDHFDSVWCIAQGHQSVDSVAQTIARLRDGVPRHIWMPEKAPGYYRIGNGSTSHHGLMKSTSKVAQQNIKSLERADREAGEWADWDGWNEQPNYLAASLQAWSKKACIFNSDVNRYREAIIEKLLSEGYILHEPEESDPEENREIKKFVETSAEEGYDEYCEDVPEASTLTEVEYTKLQKKRSKTKAERLQLRKGELVERYGGIEITPDLVKKDDDGWHGKLRLHYYLTIGSALLVARDRKKVDEIKGDDGAIFALDINKRCKSVEIAALKVLGIELFLDPDAEFTKASLERWFASLVKMRWDIKSCLGVSINPDTDSGISVAQRLLKKIGLKLHCVSHRRTEDGKRERVYKFLPPTDSREEIFTSWYDREKPVSPVEVAA